MPAERYYIPKHFVVDDVIAVSDKEFHHLIHVMRSNVSDTIELANGMGQLAVATVIKVEKKQALVKIDSIKEESPPAIEMTLAQALPKLNRLDFIIEKATELGVSQIWLFPGKKSEKKDLNNNQLERLYSIAASAMKQSGNLFLPQIKLMPYLDKWASFDYPAFFGDLNPLAPLFSTKLLELSNIKKVIFFIGPEKGFDDKEIDLMKMRNIIGVKLHSLILRTDTASLIALAIISHLIKT